MHDKTVLLPKSKLNSIKISRILIDSNISHDQNALINNDKDTNIKTKSVYWRF